MIFPSGLEARPTKRSGFESGSPRMGFSSRSVSIAFADFPRRKPPESFMFEITLQTLKKRVPLTISRGSSTHSTVFWLRWREEGVEGWGEMIPFSIDEHPQTAEVLTVAIEKHRGWLTQ